MSIWIVSVLLILTLILLITEKLPIDLAAMEKTGTAKFYAHEFILLLRD